MRARFPVSNRFDRKTFALEAVQPDPACAQESLARGPEVALRYAKDPVGWLSFQE